MAFEKTKQIELEKRNILYQEFEDDRMGTRHVHVEMTDDHEKTFIVAFPTPVNSSEGLPHILEHMVFCGSQRYPVKDTFLSLSGRTIATYFNAITTDDFTFYVFRTADQQDFLNLARLYLDTVFNPFLNPLDFKQEAWRYELTSKEIDGRDEEALTRQGIVLNEMKGHIFTADRHIKAEVHRFIKPHTSEASGSGLPEFIPDATYEDVKAFHEKHYHPSRAVIMTSGDVPVSEVQKLVEEIALNGRNDRVPPLPRSTPLFFTEDRQADVGYPVASESLDGHKYKVFWAWNGALTLAQAMEARVIARVIAKKMKTQISDEASCFFQQSNTEAGYLEMTFENLKEQDYDGLRERAVRVLQTLAQNGIDSESYAIIMKEALYDAMENEEREKGFHMLTRYVMPSLMRGYNPLSKIDSVGMLPSILDKIKNPDYLKEKIQEILDMPCAEMRIYPDLLIAQEQRERERQTLSTLQKSLSTAQRQAIREEMAALEKHQERAVDMSCLPRISPLDVRAPESQLKYTTFEVQEAGPSLMSVESLHQELVRIELHIDIHALPIEDVRWLNLYFDVLYNGSVKELKAGKADPWTHRLANQVAMGHEITPGPDGALYSELAIVAKGMRDDIPALCDLIAQRLSALDVHDEPLLRKIIERQYKEDEGKWLHKSLYFARTEALGFIDEARSLSGACEGYQAFTEKRGHYHASLTREGLRVIKDHLTEIHQKVRASPCFLKAQGSHESMDLIHKAGSLTFKDLQPATRWQGECMKRVNARREPAQLACHTNAQVNECLMIVKAPEAHHPDVSVVRLIAALMESYVMTEVRVKRGAYAGFVRYDGSGELWLNSKRDPNVKSTFDIFDQAMQWALGHPHSEDAILKAKISVIEQTEEIRSREAAIDIEMQEFKMGATPEVKSLQRERMLHCNLEDIRACIKKHLLAAPRSRVVVAGPSGITEAEQMGFNVVKMKDANDRDLIVESRSSLRTRPAMS